MGNETEYQTTCSVCGDETDGEGDHANCGDDACPTCGGTGEALTCMHAGCACPCDYSPCPSCTPVEDYSPDSWDKSDSDRRMF
jgi:hypothetical protein